MDIRRHFDRFIDTKGLSKEKLKKLLRQTNQTLDKTENILYQIEDIKADIQTHASNSEGKEGATNE